MEEKTILELARNYKRRLKPNTYKEEHFELVKAWLNDEISISQINFALTNGKTQCTAKGINMMGYCMREMYKKGLIILKD